MKFTREFYIPKNATKITDKLSDAVAYFYADKTGRPCARGFAGKAVKPTFAFMFRSAAEREKHVTEFFQAQRQRAAARVKRREDMKAEGRGMVVGDVLRASWGYDQTNIDYYEVTALIGKNMVEIRALKQKRIETQAMQGKCVPLPGEYAGEAMRRVARGGSVKIEKWGCYARVVAPQIVGTIKFYGADHWTSYH